MRISADIIDGESQLESKEENEPTPASSSEQINASEQAKIVQEVTKKMDALNLLDDLPSSSHSENASAFNVAASNSYSNTPKNLEKKAALNTNQVNTDQPLTENELFRQFARFFISPFAIQNSPDRDPVPEEFDFNNPNFLSDRESLMRFSAYSMEKLFDDHAIANYQQMLEEDICCVSVIEFMIKEMHGPRVKNWWLNNKETYQKKYLEYSINSCKGIDWGEISVPPLYCPYGSNPKSTFNVAQTAAQLTRNIIQGCQSSETTKEPVVSEPAVRVKKRRRSKRKPKYKCKPKKPSSAFFLYLTEIGYQLKKDNPGFCVTEVTQKASEMWKEVTDKSKWEEKAADLKKKFEKAMAEYEASGIGKLQEVEEETLSSEDENLLVVKSASSSESNEPSSSNDSDEFVLQESLGSDVGENSKEKAEGPCKGSELDDTGDATKMNDSPPPWFQQYIIKMKREIKEEILEELTNASTDLKQVHVPEALHSSAVLKEEKFTHCLAEESGEVVHSDIYCDNCDQLIHGIRYKCGNCSDFDLCQECESLPNVHNKNHIFLKIRYPIALKMYQKQKWSELMSPLPVKPSKYSDFVHSKNRSKKEKKLYEAKFLSDETVPDGFVVPPSTRFVKSWRVINSGIRVWTHATKLHLIQGSIDLVPSNDQIDVPHLKPGEDGIVSVLFTSPSTPGVYRSHWNFCHKSRPFGDIVWCHIVVRPIQDEQKNDQSETSNKQPEKIINKQVEVSNIAQVLTAVKEDQDNNSMVPMKILVNSHTATPNNTPFALTPPKSPDHESLSKSVSEIASDKTYLRHSNGSECEDDECSVLSLNSSSDSDTEFVVIPMPKCFDLSESFITQHLQLPLNLVETEKIQEEDVKEPTPVKNVINRSGTVSQETGVPELSSETLVSLDIGHSETMRVTHVGTDGSSSEISIIESENSSPTVENASQIFDSLNVKISTDNLSEIEKIELSLVDGPSDVTNNISELINHEQLKDIPSNATFPKFPVEGVTGEIFERTNIETNQTSQWSNLNNPEERTIQVLPEGLVFGALSAAASVYNTAKAVISTMQPKTENTEGPSQPFQRMSPTVQRDNLPANRTENLDPMDQLIEMGFCNRLLNESLLKKHNGDVASVVAELVSLNDNDWHASRHSSSSPPEFWN